MAQMMVAGAAGCIMVDFGDNDNESPETKGEVSKAEKPKAA